MLKVTWTYKGYKSETYVNKKEVFLGRLAGAFKPHVCLNLDLSIQPKHARLFRKEDMWWVEDLETPHGTFLNGEKISEPMVIMPGDKIELGQSLITVQDVDGEDAKKLSERKSTPPPKPQVESRIAEPNRSAPNTDFSSKTSWLAPVVEQLPENILVGSDGSARMICAAVSARNRGPIFFDTSRDDAQDRLARLFELPLELAAANELSSLCHKVLHRITEMIPGAKRGAFLVLDDKTNKLALRAGIPADDPPISRTLIKRAAATGDGFIWNSGSSEGITASIQQQSIASGMFAPLLWQDEIVGVLTVDNPENANAFTDEDLRMFMAVAHYAASAIQSHLLQHQLSDYSTVLERLLTNFSPKIRQTLVDKALNEGLQPGGALSDVTLLMSDFRSFSRITKGMRPADVVEMLNDYYSVLVKTIFAHQGTIDKFIGDSILAVFGSPDEDADQVRHAIDAALEMQVEMRKIIDRREMAGKPFCDFGVGIHRGEVLHGFIGADDRLEYTVVGETVNLTARYCSGAKADEILVSRSVWEAAREDYRFEERTIETKHEGDLEAWSVICPIERT